MKMPPLRRHFFCPLSAQLIARIGIIAAAMSYSPIGVVSAILITIFVFAVLCLINFVCFIFSLKILAVIGKNGLSSVTRLNGKLLLLSPHN
jgi:multiple antibiotic resistance protein